MITIEKLKLFDKYQGDLDDCLRSEGGRNYKLFEHGEWLLIDTFHQDAQLLNHQFAADGYLEKVLCSLRDVCDRDSFDMLADKINVYADFKKVAKILSQLRKHISPEDDMIWAGFANAADFLTELDSDLVAIQNCSYSALSRIQIEFAVTSTYQEIAMSNGWSNDYLKLAEQFDKLYDRLKKRNIKSTNALPDTKHADWWRFFLRLIK